MFYGERRKGTATKYLSWDKPLFARQCVYVTQDDPER